MLLKPKIKDFLSATCAIYIFKKRKIYFMYKEKTWLLNCINMMKRARQEEFFLYGVCSEKRREKQAAFETKAKSKKLKSLVSHIL
jgi:hypothetical protein